MNTLFEKDREKELEKKHEKEYEKVRVLKESGTKSVYIVKHIHSDELMIMKEMAGSHEIYKDLLDIKHKNLQEIYEVFFELGKTYLICEYVVGDSLEDILKEKPLHYKDVKNYILQLCDGVKALHTSNRPLVHRDIKPSNIICSKNFGLKLIDYDTVREHKDGGKGDTALLGTEGYAAPEQYGFAQTDEKTDIYAIGMVMLKMLAGADFENADNYQGQYKAVVKKCLQLDPSKRFKSVAELINALDGKGRCKIVVTAVIALVSVSAIAAIVAIVMFPGVFPLPYHGQPYYRQPYYGQPYYGQPYYSSSQISNYYLQGGWTAYEYVDDMISGLNYLFFLDNKVFNTFFLDDVPATIRFGRYSVVGDLFIYEYVYLDPANLAPLTWIVERSEGFIELSGNQEILSLSLNSRSQDNIRPYFRDIIFPQEQFVDIINLLMELDLFGD